MNERNTGSKSFISEHLRDPNKEVDNLLLQLNLKIGILIERLIDTREIL